MVSNIKKSKNTIEGGPKRSTKVKVKTDAIYVAVLKESDDAFLRNESLCMPLFSLELKNAYFKTSFFGDETKSF